ncbi:hypothetical protein KI387_029282, partial [Taxus chinensis]
MFSTTPSLCFTLLFALVSIAAAGQGSPSNQTHTTFVYNKFNVTSSLILFQSASIQSEVVRLTNDSKWVIGRLLYSSPLEIKKNNTLSSFSTTFVMAMVPPIRAEGTGHGIAFIMTPTASLMEAYSADYLGLFNDTSNGQDYNHIFAVEFDTSQTVGFQDPSANHVGVDLNSLESSYTHDAGYWDGQKFVNVTLKSGRKIQAWIDYDHVQDQINVSMTLAGMFKPEKPLISHKNMNLSAILQDRVYVGFSSATGNFFAEHYILAWSFTTNGTAPDLDISNLPNLMRRKNL